MAFVALVVVDEGGGNVRNVLFQASQCIATKKRGPLHSGATRGDDAVVNAEGDASLTYKMRSVKYFLLFEPIFVG